jgi:hypothetical protein
MKASDHLSVLLLQLSKKYVYIQKALVSRRFENIQKGCAERSSNRSLICERCLFDNSSGLFSMHVSAASRSHSIKLRNKTHASPPNYNIARDLHPPRVKSRIEKERKRTLCCVYILCLIILLLLSHGIYMGVPERAGCFCAPRAPSLFLRRARARRFLFLFCTKPLGNFKRMIYINVKALDAFFHSAVCLSSRCVCVRLYEREINES